MTEQRPPLPHRGRAWLLGVLVPAVVTAAAWAVVVPLLPRVPEPAALHWGTSGVDRTGSITELVTAMAVPSAVSLVVVGVFAVLTGRQALTRRLTAGLAVGLATVFAVATVGTVLVQLDAPTATDAGPLDWWVAGSLLGGVVLGGAAAALAGADPAQPARAAVPADAATADLPEGQRAVWVQDVAGLSTTTTRLLLVLGIVAGVLGWLLADTLIPLIAFAPALVLMLTMTRWRVRVDARGITARGHLGRPLMFVPADEVERADVTQVRPFAEFGGWGLRTATSGTVGVVIRKGEGIAVQRTGGRRFVVTVDDAATGAALLNTYAGRARAVGRAADH